MKIKERIDILAYTYKEDNEVLEMIHDTMNSFSDYVKVVNEMENFTTIMRFRLEHDEYVQSLQNIDRNRRLIHNGVISGVKMLNNLCKAKGLELLYNGDTSDRYSVGSFAMAITKEIFDNRK